MAGEGGGHRGACGDMKMRVFGEVYKMYIYNLTEGGKQPLF
jgi:hypothetical protein